MRCPLSTRLYLSHRTSLVRPFPVRPVLEVTVDCAAVGFLVVASARNVEDLSLGESRKHSTENIATNTHGRLALFRLPLVLVVPPREGMPSSAFVSMRVFDISCTEFITQSFADFNFSLFRMKKKKQFQASSSQLLLMD